MSISVIIPVFNASRFLEKAVQSVLAQEEVNEILLIEDGSTDNSLEVCRRLATEFEKIKLLQHPNGENKGAGASRNVGLKNASQKFIAFLDADDFYLEGRFKNHLKYLNLNNEIDATFGAVKAEFETEKSERLYTKEVVTTISDTACSSSQQILDAVLEGKGFIHLNGLTLRRSSLKNDLVFDEHLRQAQDADFLYQLLLKKNVKSENTDEIVAVRFVHDGNRIHDLVKAHIYTSQLCSKWLEDKEFVSSISPQALRKLFYRKYSFGVKSSRMKRTLNAINDYRKMNALRNALSFRDLFFLIKTDFK